MSSKKIVYLKKGESFIGGKVVKHSDFLRQQSRAKEKKLVTRTIQANKPKTLRTKITVSDTGKQTGLIRFRGGSLGKETEAEISKFKGGKVIRRNTIRGRPSFIKEETSKKKIVREEDLKKMDKILNKPVKNVTQNDVNLMVDTFNKTSPAISQSQSNKMINLIDKKEKDNTISSKDSDIKKAKLVKVISKVEPTKESAVVRFSRGAREKVNEKLNKISEKVKTADWLQPKDKDLINVKIAKELIKKTPDWALFFAKDVPDLAIQRVEEVFGQINLKNLSKEDQKLVKEQEKKLIKEAKEGSKKAVTQFFKDYGQAVKSGDPKKIADAIENSVMLVLARPRNLKSKNKGIELKDLNELDKASLEKTQTELTKFLEEAKKDQKQQQKRDQKVQKLTKKHTTSKKEFLDRQRQERYKEQVLKENLRRNEVRKVQDKINNKMREQLELESKTGRADPKEVNKIRNDIKSQIEMLPEFIESKNKKLTPEQKAVTVIKQQSKNALREFEKDLKRGTSLKEAKIELEKTLVDIKNNVKADLKIARERQKARVGEVIEIRPKKEVKRNIEKGEPSPTKEIRSKDGTVQLLEEPKSVKEAVKQIEYLSKEKSVSKARLSRKELNKLRIAEKQGKLVLQRIRSKVGEKYKVSLRDKTRSNQKGKQDLIIEVRNRQDDIINEKVSIESIEDIITGLRITGIPKLSSRTVKYQEYGKPPPDEIIKLIKVPKKGGGSTIIPLKKLKALLKKQKKKNKRFKLEDFFAYTPTLRGTNVYAVKTKGVFTGLEVRGKKPLVDVAKKGKTKEGRVAKVKEHQRRIPIIRNGRMIKPNFNLLKKAGLLKGRK